MCDLAAAINPAIVGLAGWNCTKGIPLPSEICVWGGVYCNGNSTVTDIFLSYNTYLTGTLPTSIGSLSLLANLFVSVNKLSGILPTSIGGLTSLINFAVGYNQFTGILPTSMGNMLSLTNFNAAYNKLSGPLPISVGKMTSLIQLFLVGNKLTGPIPISIGGLKNMQNLVLSGNKLTGTLPTSIGELLYLTLALSYNMLVGVVPQSFCNVYGSLSIQSSGLVCYPACLSTMYNLGKDNTQGVCTSSPTGSIYPYN